VDGVEILLCNIDGSFYAIENRCSHAASKLSNGRLRGHDISCPMHGARFDVRSGAPVAPPARTSVRTFEVILEAGKVNIVSS
jgi:3-phenylpropionate/trans-cinnamate dioxygenase ferredoxin subunit